MPRKPYAAYTEIGVMCRKSERCGFMILEPKKTTVAYRCPECGAGVLSIVGMFSLSANRLKLKCDCGKSELDVVLQDDKVRLTVPCIFCRKTHVFTVNKQIFYGRDLFVITCPYSDINICFMGEENHVRAELARSELELLDMLEENGISDFSAFGGDGEVLPDPDEVMDVRWVSADDLSAELARDPDSFAAWFITAAPMVLARLA